MRVEPLDDQDATVPHLVRHWTFKPYRWTDVPEDSIVTLAVSRLRQSLAGADVWVRVARDLDGRVCGLVMLQHLPWDSRMLGIAAARLEFVVTGEYPRMRSEAFAALLDAAAGEARRRGSVHLSVRVDAGDHAAIHALESAGFLLVDTLLTFECAVAGNPLRGPAPGLTLREAREDDIHAIVSMAADSFVDGRFHADPSIRTDAATAIYREWAASCCKRTAADDVIVAATPAGEVAGFVACRIHSDTGIDLGRLTASIVLIATTAAARRRGVGRALVMASLEWGAARSAVAMQVGTQIRNTAAARLYEQCGFRLAAGSQSFRAMITPRGAA